MIFSCHTFYSVLFYIPSGFVFSNELEFIKSGVLLLQMLFKNRLIVLVQMILSEQWITEVKAVELHYYSCVDHTHNLRSLNERKKWRVESFSLHAFQNTQTNSGYLNGMFKRSLLNFVVHNESLKCERLKSQKIRRRPESCHGFHPEVSFYFFIIIISVSSSSFILFIKRQIGKLPYKVKLIGKYSEYSELN